MYAVLYTSMGRRYEKKFSHYADAHQFARQRVREDGEVSLWKGYKQLPI